VSVVPCVAIPHALIVVVIGDTNTYHAVTVQDNPHVNATVFLSVADVGADAYLLTISDASDKVG